MTQINAESNNDDFLYKKITYEIRGACFDVWKEFRDAFKEIITDRALTIALEKRGLTVQDKVSIDIYYEGKIVGKYIPDKIVNGVILIELKSKPFITQEDKRQFWLYLQASEYRIGLLINFGTHKLEIIRRIYDSARKKSLR